MTSLLAVHSEIEVVGEAGAVGTAAARCSRMGWKIVIPADSLLSNEPTRRDRSARSVSDIKLFLGTYSNSGN